MGCLRPDATGVVDADRHPPTPVGERRDCSRRGGSGDRCGAATEVKSFPRPPVDHFAGSPREMVSTPCLSAQTMARASKAGRMPRSTTRSPSRESAK
jgi:hypothetical protein